MARRIYSRVEVYKKNGIIWETTPTVLTEARNIVVRRGIGKIKDTFEFKLLNAHNKYFSGGTSVIESDDRIKIYMWTNSDWSSLTTTQKNYALQIDGVVSEINQDVVGGRVRDILVKGTGFIDIIFKGLVFVREPTLTQPHTLIQNIIAQLNSQNSSGRRIYGANSSEWSNIGNATTKRDGSSFPSIQYTSSYKSAIEIIEDLSSDKYTNDGAYNYYVEFDPDLGDNGEYVFRWLAKDINPDNAVNITEGTTNMFNINLKKNHDKVINAVIYNVGFDCNEHGREFLKYDPSAMVSGGGSWKYYTDTHTIISDLIQQEYDNDRSKWDETPDGYRKSNYPKSSEYPWTFQFKERNTDGSQKATYATATDDDDFNDKIVKEAEWLGGFKAQQLIDRYGEPKWSGEITLPLDNTIADGALIKINSETYNMVDFFIRATEIHTDCFTTKLVVEEDEKSISIESGGS